jgi:hypothetical protein
MDTLTFYAPLSAIGRRRRAASLKQVVGQRVQEFLQQLWASLEAYGHRRAAPYLLQQADRLADSDPTLADDLRRMARRATRFNQPVATATSKR